MISNCKFLVSTDMGIDTFMSNGPTVLDRLKVAMALTSSKNVYVFDTYNDAMIFTNTRGGAKPEWSPFQFFKIDFPVFEVEVDHLITEPRLHNGLRVDAGAAKEYSNGIKVKTLTKDTIYQVVKELFLQQNCLLAAHSSGGVNYALSPLKITVKHESDCRVM